VSVTDCASSNKQLRTSSKGKLFGGAVCCVRLWLWEDFVHRWVGVGVGVNVCVYM